MRSTLSAEARLWLPGARTVKDAIPLATRPTGELYRLPLWLAGHGARHPIIGGATGSGKSVLINDLMAGLAPCYDVVIWYIEIAKEGQGAAAWASCIDWLATDLLEALKMLKAFRRVGKARMKGLARQAAKGKGSDKVVPSAKDPLVVLIIDEAAALFATIAGDPEILAMTAEATDVAGKVAAELRAAAGSLLVATQRPTVESLGSNGTFRSQLFPNLCLRMNKRGDTKFVLQDVDLDMIDATQLTAPGAMYIQDTAGDEPLPLRTLTLHEPADIFALASLYGPHLKGLRTASDIEAAGADYARRTIPTEMFADPDDEPTPTRPIADVASPPAATQPAPAALPAAGGAPATATDIAKARESRKKVNEALAAMRVMVDAGEQLEPLPQIPFAQLAEQHQAEPAPEQPGDAESIVALLTVLADAPDDGMTATEIVRETGRTERTVPKSSAYRLLTRLCNEGKARRTNVGKGAAPRYRYHAAQMQDANA
jgi:hypothetical protein